MFVLGLGGKVFAAGGCRGIFCEKRPRATPCRAEPAPAGSKMNAPLAKDEPISDAGGICVIPFKKGQKNTAQQL